MSIEQEEFEEEKETQEFMGSVITYVEAYRGSVCPTTASIRSSKSLKGMTIPQDTELPTNVILSVGDPDDSWSWIGFSKMLFADDTEGPENAAQFFAYDGDTLVAGIGQIKATDDNNMECVFASLWTATCEGPSTEAGTKLWKVSQFDPITDGSDVFTNFDNTDDVVRSLTEAICTCWRADIIMKQDSQDLETRTDLN